MIRHFISMILAGWALLGFMFVTDGIWESIDWMAVLTLYGSIVPLCIWVTWIVITKGGNNRR
jgi:hypothetical protein